jgi:uncharacterized protein YdeI (YjbR/CyaY-like superfamily)
MKTDIRVTEYIEKSAPFAHEILDFLRETVHTFCPEIEETIKWNFPVFMYKGKILCNMAAFKNHCSFGFWLAAHMKTTDSNKDGMGDLGKITRFEELPKEVVLSKMIKEAMELTDAGKTIVKKTKESEEIEISDEFQAFLATDLIAKENFDKFAPSHKKEYIRWVLEAKTENTKLKRVRKMIDNLQEGKPQNWKYM